jgi:DNA-directed RNA polymerase II subunit RPB2
MIVNKATGECMKFLGGVFTYEKTDIEKGEFICNPDTTTTKKIKDYANYRKLQPDGVPKVGTMLEKGDVILGKIKKDASDNEYSLNGNEDRSQVYKAQLPSEMNRVYYGNGDVDSNSFCKIGMKMKKPILPGDKVSARSGQKGIVSVQLQQSDMPFTKDGIIPDMIMNPHSFPKRMTIGHIYEGAMSRIATEIGEFIDGTFFNNINSTEIIKKMEDIGFKNHGYERLYSGEKGTWIDSLIFMNPMYYQRLQKFVSMSIYSIDIGPTDILTRQPLDGKSNQGGLKISELQRDTILAHGCAKFFSEKFFDDSDDFTIYYCTCGRQAIVNLQLKKYLCNVCQENSDIYAINSSWSSKQFFMELDAMNIGVKFQLKPLEFFTVDV